MRIYETDNIENYIKELGAKCHRYRAVLIAALAAIPIAQVIGLFAFETIWVKYSFYAVIKVASPFASIFPLIVAFLAIIAVNLPSEIRYQRYALGSEKAANAANITITAVIGAYTFLIIVFMPYMTALIASAVAKSSGAVYVTLAVTSNEILGDALFWGALTWCVAGAAYKAIRSIERGPMQTGLFVLSVFCGMLAFAVVMLIFKYVPSEPFEGEFRRALSSDCLIIVPYIVFSIGYYIALKKYKRR